jgi:hypothetical protein
MTWKGTCEIEEGDQTKETDQTEAEAEADAAEIRRSNESRFSHTLDVGNSPRADRYTSL